MTGSALTAQAAARLFTLARAVVYATLFIGFLLVYVPSAVVRAGSIPPPAPLGAPQVIGMLIGAAGAALAIACVLTFALLGRGTPAPFDPPRRLVDRGPYRRLRNPMYLGAGLAMAGAALFYQSLGLLAYTTAFFVATHLFVVGYEEPTLRRLFNGDYDAYCRQVARWGLV
jgi:protein-S-isoprenylcysteine O-methyltransferase Ste14